MTKGKALILARGILGPSARLGRPFNIVLVDASEVEVICGGESWDHALQAAKETSDARAWSDKQISDANLIESAEDSLRKAAKLDLLTRLTLHGNKPQVNPIRVKLAGTAKCRCGKVISANKNHCAVCPSEINTEPPSRGFAEPEGLVQS